MKNLLFAGLLLILAVRIGWWAGQSQGALSGARPGPAPTTSVAAPASMAPVGVAQRPEATTTAASERDADAAPSTASYALTSAQVTDLPAAGLPLRTSISALVAAHRGGHLPATLRLLRELTDCERYRWSSMRMDMLIAFEESPHARRGGERMQAAMSSAAATVAGLAEQCDGLPADFDEALLFDVQRRAADSGDLAGQLMFVLAPALTLNKALQQLDRLSAYRQLAPQYLQRALEQGSGQAVAAFMDGYEHFAEGWRGPAGEGTALQQQVVRKMMQAMRPLTPLQQVLGEDLSLAYRYAWLCKRACNGTDQARAEAALARISAALESADRNAAETAADALYDAHFAARKRPADIDLDALRQASIGFRR